MEKLKCPELRFSQFKNDWNETILGNLSQIRRGASPRPIEDPKWFDNDGVFGWLRIADVTQQNGRIFDIEQKLSVEGQKKTLILEEPHLILSIAATVGKPVINYVPTGIHDGFIVFLNLNADREFTFQWLERFRPNWFKLGQPGSQLNLNSELVKNQSIFLSPLMEEQTQIGNFFQNLDQSIALHEKKLAQTQNLKKAMLEKMFPKVGSKQPEIRLKGFSGEWGETTLGAVVDIVGGGTPDTNVAEFWNGDIDWYSPTEIGENVYANGSLKKITASGLKNSSAKVLPAKKTVLFSSRAGIGEMAILNKSAATNQGFQSFIANNIDVYFLYSMGFKIKKFALSKASGSTFLEISRNQLAQMEFLIPSSEEQKEIGNFFKQLDETLALQQQQLQTLKNLKQAFLEKMFV